MTKIRVQLNWGLQPGPHELKIWEIFTGRSQLPGRTIEIDFPTPFYKEAFQELLNEGLKATLINISINGHNYKITFNGEVLELERE